DRTARERRDRGQDLDRLRTLRVVRRERATAPRQRPTRTRRARHDREHGPDRTPTLRGARPALRQVATGRRRDDLRRQAALLPDGSDARSRAPAIAPRFHRCQGNLNRTGYWPMLGPAGAGECRHWRSEPRRWMLEQTPRLVDIVVRCAVLVHPRP